MHRHLHRRDLLLGAAALTATGLSTKAGAALPPGMVGNCPTPTPAQTLGPFYIPGAMRPDITEGLPGMPMTIFLRVQDRLTCAPIPGLIVDVWHADIPGTYSGFASEGTLGETFMRGAQITDARGFVRFETIFPGWYPSRTPHVHARVMDSAGTALKNTQLYFPDVVSNWVYTNHAEYLARGRARVTNTTDGIYDPDLELVMRRVGAGGYAGLTLVV